VVRTHLLERAIVANIRLTVSGHTALNQLEDASVERCVNKEVAVA
jgi:hypothetical protein